MKFPTIKSVYIVFFVVLLFGRGVAQVPERPNPPVLYNNLSREFPDFLSKQEAAALEEKLEVFSNETSNQICVVIVDDFGGTDDATFATELGETWGVGKAGKNNGIVVLVKPTKQDGGRRLFIAVGYGLEGAIPDLATKRIREEQIQPLLKAGRNYEALDAGTTVLMQLAKGEINVKDYTRGNNKGGGWITVLIIVIVVLLFLRNMFGGGRGGGRTMSAGEAFLWGNLFGSAMGHKHRSSSGWGSGGSSWGGGSSGGGWGGFGGGSFGGGGSGGSW